MADGNKPLAGRSSLTPADVLRMTLPSFWYSPQGSEFHCRTARTEVALMGLEGLGIKVQRNLLNERVNFPKRRLKIKKYRTEWWIPTTATTAYLLGEYWKERPETSPTSPFFVNRAGLPLQLQELAHPFERADELLGAELPLTTMLAEFCAANTGQYEETRVVLAFRAKRWPGSKAPPTATMREMVKMIDATDPFKGDLRVYENEAYAEEKIKALGGSDLPRCLWDLVKSRNLGRQYKQRLPDDHPMVVKIRKARSQLPASSRALTAERDIVFDELMPEIEPMILDGSIAAEQVADLFGFTEKSFGWKRAWWRKGGTAARKAAYAAGPKKSQAKKRPSLTKAEIKTLSALESARWPLADEDISIFRQTLVDQHFPTVAKIIRDGNLKGYRAAELFRTKATVISDLRADIAAGSELVVMTTTDPEERAIARAFVEKAVAGRRDDQTLADIARLARSETGLRISSEFVRAISEMMVKRDRAAQEPKRKRRPRNLRQHGLKPSAAKALWCLDIERGKTLKQLASEWGCSPTNASHVVGELVAAGLARRPRDPTDGRNRSVTLTEEGLALRLKFVSPTPALDEMARIDEEASVSIVPDDGSEDSFTARLLALAREVSSGLKDA